MAERITPPPYWRYDVESSPDGEEAVIVARPVRGTREGTYKWEYDYTPRVGDHCRVVSNRDGDRELLIEFDITKNPDAGGQYYIFEECVGPAVPPIPETIDLTKPTDIEKWLEEA